MGDSNKSISFFGLVAMGIGCMLGTSWLLLTGPWLEVAGGPLNLAVAFALCIVVELPFAFAYMEAIPMLPRKGGEVVYSSAAFGPGGGFAVGWAGVLMNSIVFCWVDLAAISLLDELFPALGRVGLLYTVGGHSVTLPNVLCQLALAGAIVYIQYRGADLCASLAKLATVVLLTMCLAGLAVCFSHFDPAVYAADGGLEFHFSGSASLLSMLVFSVAGWETVAKAAADATGSAARKAGAALITCLLIVTALLCLVPTAVAGNLPWRTAVDRTAPFADVLVSITGWPAVRLAFLATAFVGAVGVMNSTLYSSSGLVNGCDVVLFGAPTINRNAPEAIWHAVHAVDAINTKGRAAGAFGSFGWTGEAADMLQAQLAQLKFKTLEKPFKVCFRPTEADLAAVADYARAVAALTAPAKPAAPKAQKYVCSICGYIYDPEQGDAKGGVAPGTPFESLPADWVCPLCRMGREMFKPAP